MVWPSADVSGTSRKVVSFLIGKQRNFLGVLKMVNKSTHRHSYPKSNPTDAAGYYKTVWYKPVWGVQDDIQRYQLNTFPPTPQFCSIKFKPLRGPPFPAKYSWIPVSNAPICRAALERAYLQERRFSPGKRTSLASLRSSAVIDVGESFLPLLAV